MFTLPSSTSVVERWYSLFGPLACSGVGTEVWLDVGGDLHPDSLSTYVTK